MPLFEQHDDEIVQHFVWPQVSSSFGFSSWKAAFCSSTTMPSKLVSNCGEILESGWFCSGGCWVKELWLATVFQGWFILWLQLGECMFRQVLFVVMCHSIWTEWGPFPDLIYSHFNTRVENTNHFNACSQGHAFLISIVYSPCVHPFDGTSSLDLLSIQNQQMAGLPNWKGWLIQK